MSPQSTDSAPWNPGHTFPQPQRRPRARNHRTRDTTEPPAVAAGLPLFPGKRSTTVPPVRLPRVRITLAPSLTQPSGPPTCCPLPCSGGRKRRPLGPALLEGGRDWGSLGGSSQKGVSGSNFLAGAASWGWRARAAWLESPRRYGRGVPGGLCWPRGPGAVMGTRPGISTPDVRVEGNPGSGAAPLSPSLGGLRTPSAGQGARSGAGEGAK